MSPRDNSYRKPQRIAQGRGQEGSEEASFLLQTHTNLLENAISATEFLKIGFKIIQETDYIFTGFSYKGNSSDNCQNNGQHQDARSVIEGLIEFLL